MDGKLYKRIRLSLGYTAAELSKKVGVGANYILMMEAGVRPVSDKQSEKIINLFKEAIHNDVYFKDLIHYGILVSSETHCKND